MLQVFTKNNICSDSIHLTCAAVASVGKINIANYSASARIAKSKSVYSLKDKIQMNSEIWIPFT